MMNSRKICFIYCVNDETLLQESLKYLTYLHIPEGFEIDVITVREAKSMAAGYNYAMQQTDAKYKVYLHQDTLIINWDFISDCAGMFERRPQLGMLGMVGAGYMPDSGIWWDSPKKFGKVYESHTGKMELLAFDEAETDFSKVAGIDGFLMVTQYDLPWREDLFQGWHFYDLSQSAEFIKAGYEIGVPRQDEPWTMHDCGVVNVRNGYEEYRQLYLNNYSSIIKDSYRMFLEDILNFYEEKILKTKEDDITTDYFDRLILNKEILQLEFETTLSS